MKTHCRCRTCRTRRVLKRHPAEYRNRKICPKCKARNQYDSTSCDECKTCLSTLPKCDHCGARNFTADKWMNERNTRATLCTCDGYHFPYHRAGSLKCKFTTAGEYRYGLPEDLPGIALDF